jgi:hypothetical protein
MKLRTRVSEHVHERIDGEKVDAPAREVTALTSFLKVAPAA